MIALCGWVQPLDHRERASPEYAVGPAGRYLYLHTPYYMFAGDIYPVRMWALSGGKVHAALVWLLQKFVDYKQGRRESAVPRAGGTRVYSGMSFLTVIGGEMTVRIAFAA